MSFGLLVRRLSAAVILACVCPIVGSAQSGGGGGTVTVPIPIPIPALQFVTSTLPTAVSGTSYATTLQASGGTPPYRWVLLAATGGGLTLAPNGILAGNPGPSGVVGLTILLTDNASQQAVRNLSLTVTGALTILPSGLPGAQVGLPYNAKLSVSGGGGTAQLRVNVGTLPPGVGFNDGVIAGLPTTAGDYRFDVLATTNLGASAVRGYTVSVVDPLRIVSTSIPPAPLGLPYKAALWATGGIAPLRWALAGGSLPRGITLDAGGVLGGVPSQTGSFSFTVRVTDSSSTSSGGLTATLQLAIASPLSISTASQLPAATLNSAYRMRLQASGGAPPYQWSVSTPTSGMGLPPGVTFSADGELNGAPNKAGTFSFVATAMDAASQRSSRSFSISVTDATVLTTGVSPSIVNVTRVENSGVTHRSVQVSTSSGSPVSYGLNVFYDQAPGGWLTVPSTVTASAIDVGVFSMAIDPSRLTAGTYAARITVATALGVVDTVQVLLAVGPDSRLILPVPAGLTFTATEGGPSPGSQRVAIVNSGSGLLNWSATSSTLAGGEWLKVGPSGGVSDANGSVSFLTVTAFPGGLAAGDYYGQITISSPGALNSSQSVTVVLSVRPAGGVAEVTPQPTGAALIGTAAQEITLLNTGHEAVDFFVSENALIVVSPTTGRVQPGDPVKLSVQAAANTAGSQRTTLDLAFSNGLRRQVDLALVGSRENSTSSFVQGDSIRPLAVTCSPTQLVAVSTLLGAGFTIPAGWPTPLEVRIVDDCGAAMNRGSVTVSFTNGDAPLSLVSLGEGRWSGTWVGKNAVTPQVTVTVTAEDPVTPLRGTYQTSGGVQINPEPPIVADGGVVNAASYLRNAPLAPGSYISIFGSKLATATAIDETLPLDPTLGVTTVTLGGRILPLKYASGGQINAVVPFSVPLDTPLGMLIRRGNSLSVPENVVVTNSQPGIFTRDQSGRGQGLIVNANFQIMDASNPGKSGEAAVIFSTGLGKVRDPIEAGEAAPSNPLARAEMPVSVTVGNVPAEVIYAGLAPGFAGLYQVNIVLPLNVPVGEAIPVVLTAGSRSSSPVTISIR